MNRQIAEAVQQIIGVLGAAVVIQAQHTCVIMRSVEKQSSFMVTSVMFGEFHDNAVTCNEFPGLIRWGQVR